MDDEDFANGVSMWLDPEILFGSAQRYQDNRENANAPATLLIKSGRLRSGDEANFAVLVRKYLRAFRVHPEIIDIIKCQPVASIVSDDSWHWLSTLSFEGEVCVLSQADEDGKTHTILQVKERDAVVDILHGPIVGLLDSIDRCAVTWQRVAENNLPVFHVPTTPMPFCNFIDTQVAAAYLKFRPRPHTSGSSGLNERYRAVTVYGKIDANDPDWIVSGNVARSMAGSTFNPIPKSK